MHSPIDNGCLLAGHELPTLRIVRSTAPHLHSTFHGFFGSFNRRSLTIIVLGSRVRAGTTPPSPNRPLSPSPSFLRSTVQPFNRSCCLRRDWDAGPQPSFPSWTCARQRGRDREVEGAVHNRPGAIFGSTGTFRRRRLPGDTSGGKEK